MSLQYLHTMIRVGDLDAALDFFCAKLGMVETRRYDNEKARFSLVFLAAPHDVDQAKETDAPLIELTYNWDENEYDSGRNFGHLAYRVDNIYETCQDLATKGLAKTWLQKVSLSTDHRAMVRWHLSNHLMAFQLSYYKKATH